MQHAGSVIIPARIITSYLSSIDWSKEEILSVLILVVTTTMSAMPQMSQSGFQDDQLEAGALEDVGTEAQEKPLSTTGTMVDEPQSNPNVVDWDGPGDPQHPLNWSKAQKNLHVGIVSLSTLAA